MTLAALEQAITFLSRSDLIATARQQALPPGVTEILKISSGDAEELIAAQESSRFSQEDVKHAAQFYVQQILFAPDSDHYRVLGVDPDDAEAKIKLHYRLLVRWLHPDKNASDWEVVFSDRVNRAWHALRTPERRRQYDDELKSLSAYPMIAPAPSREVKPAQWRQSHSDERFMSSRTIKRLPIAIFGLLGVGAVFALWWFSQLQPRVDPPLVSAVEPDISAPAQEPLQEMQLREPASIESTPNGPQVAERDSTLPITPADMASAPEPKPAPPVAAMPVKVPAVAQMPNKMEAPVAIKKKIEPVLVAVKKPVNETRTADTKSRPAKPLAQQTKNSDVSSDIKRKSVAGVPRAEPALLPMAKTELPAVSASSRVANESAEVIAANKFDADVNQLLQQFSRVYADGNYFALHNLFTSDLKIIGAPSQRKVLHGYRRLFETSQHREIAIQNVIWQQNDEKISVVARFQSEVLPLGENEAQSSQGNIRLDLRVENGQLKIIRLQSDAKNG